MKSLNSKALFGFATAVMSGLFTIGIASAGVVDQYTGAVGPGLGTANVLELATPNPNNGPAYDPAAGAAGNPINIDKAFANVGVIDMTFHVSDSSGITSYSIDDVVSNLTNVNWTDYHIELGFGTGANFVQSAGALMFYQPPPSTSTDFATLNQGAYTIDWSNGMIAAGAVSRQFLFQFDVPDLAAAGAAADGYADPNGGGYTFTLRQYPTVPEPAGLAIAAGICAVLSLRNRQRS